MLLEAAGLRTHLGERDAGGVVDEDLRLDELSSALMSSFLIVAARKPDLDFARVHQGFRGEHTSEERFLRHFEREDGDDLAIPERGVLRDVDGPRGLAHARDARR